MRIHWKAEVDDERDVNLDMTIYVSDAVIKCDETIITRGITVEIKGVAQDVIPLVVKAVRNRAANPDSSGDS